MADAATTIHATLRAANIARQAEWDPGKQISLSYRGNELAGEVGEACNVIKKLDRERLGIRGSRDTVAHLAEELADVVICADLIALDEGIDLDAAVAATFNATSAKVGLATRMADPNGDLGRTGDVLIEIGIERRRQITAEGWTPEHDDDHDRHEMAAAGAAYAFHAAKPLHPTALEHGMHLVSELWPWDWAWFKPTDARRDLIKAAALIIAEIERLDRAAEACPICAKPFAPDDLCASDIEMGTCHAACLEGAPVVDMETGEPRSGRADTFRFVDRFGPFVGTNAHD